MHRLANKQIGARLFTLMTVDMATNLACRSYTSDPASDPTSGTKPIEHNVWFKVVRDRHEMFVANTLADIAKVFSDHALIGTLDCGSVINLPVIRTGPLEPARRCGGRTVACLISFCRIRVCKHFLVLGRRFAVRLV